MILRHPRASGAFGTALVLLVAAGPLPAQSVTSGAVEGTVQDRDGNPLAGVGVVVLGPGDGVVRTARTGWDGRFVFDLVPPGDYTLLAERIGLRPGRVEAVPVRPGRRIRVPVVLAAGGTPVDGVHVIRYLGPVRAGPRPGVDPLPLRLGRYPVGSGELRDLAGLESLLAPPLAVEGIPSDDGRVIVDGLAFWPARHPALPVEPFSALPLSITSIERAELVTGGGDMEWSGAGGGVLSLLSRPGGQTFAIEASGSWTGGGLVSSRHFDLSTTPHGAVRGGLIASGPVRGDAARIAVGIEAERLEAPYPGPGEREAVAAEVVAIARDSFGIELGLLGRPRLAVRERVAGFASLDWRLSDVHTLAVRSHTASLPAAGPQPGPHAAPGLSARVEASDHFTTATLSSIFRNGLSQELRLGIARSVRRYTGLDDRLPLTTIVDGALEFGTPPLLPGRFARTGLEVRQTLHVRAGEHMLKTGIGVNAAFLEDRITASGPGRVRFPDAAHFARRIGLLEAPVVDERYAEFSTTELGIFLNDEWHVAPGLEIALGVRYAREYLPRRATTAAADWVRLLGLADVRPPASVGKLDARAMARWDMGTDERWLLEGELAVRHERAGTDVLSEYHSDEGRSAVRRWLGDLGAWPDPSAGGDAAPTLTVLGPGFSAPRTLHAGLGISGSLGQGTTLRAALVARRTDFLPRRVDLNLPATPSSHDQYGRPLYGELAQLGGLISAVPGSNRRFSTIDRIIVVDADGRADHLGLSLAAEHRIGSLLLFGTYTRSWRNDDTPAILAGDPMLTLSPFPRALDDRDWRAGRSDLDTPHRAFAGAEMTFPRLSGVRIAGLYRFRSGIPFTPGFGPGVDVNGDGVAGNDPAFVDTAIPGIQQLVSEWSCLRDQVGRFAERNACRTPGIHTFDLRLAVELPEIGRYALELAVDGLNLIESDPSSPDPALYLIDASRPLVRDPGTGHVEIPLVANPDFGKPIARWTTGRTLRLGVRILY